MNKTVKSVVSQCQGEVNSNISFRVCRRFDGVFAEGATSASNDEQSETIWAAVRPAGAADKCKNILLKTAVDT